MLFGWIEDKFPWIAKAGRWKTQIGANLHLLYCPPISSSSRARRRPWRSLWGIEEGGGWNVSDLDGWRLRITSSSFFRTFWYLLKCSQSTYSCLGWIHIWVQMPKLSGTIKLHIWITNTLNTLELAQCKHSVSILLLKTPLRSDCFVNRPHRITH